MAIAPLNLYWLVFVFLLGLNVGSFLNVAAARLPLDKSLLWPGSRCMSCLQPIRWYDNIPVLSYLLLGGRCRTCGASFSVRYLLVELTTGVLFAGLFYVEMILNVHGWPAQFPFWIQQGWFPWGWWAGFVFHAILLTLLLAASVCDLECREIPLQLTLTGTAIGLAGSVLMPWPWPNLAQPPPANLAPAMGGFFAIRLVPPVPAGGVYPWPFWWPLPEAFAPGGNWQTGIMTGVAGALLGTFLLRLIGSVFSAGLGKDALGLGDADLMMMAGSFLGWQPVVVAFFLSIPPALVFGAINLLFRRDGSLPFGPSLAVGLMTACLGWRWLGPHFQPLFFWGPMMVALVVVMVVFLFVSSLLLRRLRS